MQTFDQSLYKLYKEGQISLEEALKNADSKNNLRLRITNLGRRLAIEEVRGDDQSLYLGSYLVITNGRPRPLTHRKMG